MSKFTELIVRVSPITDQTKIMKEIFTILDNHMDELAVMHPEMYSDVLGEIHIAINGPYFDKETVEYATQKLKNEDGTTGAKWSIPETSSVASSLGIVFEKFNMYDWHYVMNMIYSDYCVVIGPNPSTYYSLAKAWVMDKDAPVGKAYLYYDMMCEV